MKIFNITIMGTGAYGTALANVLTDNGHKVIMYGVDENQVEDIEINNRNSIFFNETIINKEIRATTDISAALENTDVLILSVPSFAIESVLNLVKNNTNREMHIINTAKGLDEENVDLLSKKIKKIIGNSKISKSLGAIFGPSIAFEVIERKPTSLMSCNPNLEYAKLIASLFDNDYITMLPTEDLYGCEIAAALKNTVAIASGIIYGSGGGDNSQASLITIGLNEMYNIAKNFGAKLETFTNFATLGDLILTATSKKSRNFSIGIKIAQSKSAKDVLSANNTTVEGVLACKTAYLMVKKFNLTSRLFEIMYEILYNYCIPSSLLNKVFK